ncbi:MAG: M43 family zinc metalloprotease [Flavobacteriales bacterium]
MRIRTIALKLLAGTFAASSALAQQQVLPCGAEDLDALLAGHPDPAGERQRIAQAAAELEAFTAEWAQAHGGAERVAYTIPVVFHIIHNNGPENISDAQVHDAVRILNDDFNKLNPDWQNVRPDFLPIVADVGIQFKLAQKDPQGNCTNGITRTVSELTYDGTQTMKNLIQWPRNRYLNVWVAASANGAAGYTYRPASVSTNPTADGIVVLHTYLGSIGTGAPGRSRVLTHEVGHWINLAHTWGNSNNPGLPENCDGDDGVGDTPNTIGWTSCLLSGSSCGTLDNVENYMEYSYCCKMFTEGQKTRMLAALNSGTAQRNQLITASNLLATGVSQDPQLCQAAFAADRRLVCAGTPITFEDQSYNGVTGWQWSFPGATPPSAEQATATVVYEQPGTYPVSLTVTDGASTITATHPDYITVLPDPGGPWPLQEGFEASPGLNGPDWFVVNTGGDNTFEVTDAASFTGSRSLRLVNTAAMVGTTDELVSRTFDLSGAEAVVLSFRWAYARRAATNTDALSVQVSNDCGQTWVLRRIMRGSTSLPTAPNTSGNFVPDGPAQWGYAEVANISAAYHVTDFRFRFAFESDGGNNLYIDDININGTPVGFDELAAGGSAALRVMPNPARGTVRAALTLLRPSDVRLELIDATGRRALLRDLGPRPAGDLAVELPLEGLATGTYALRVLAEHGMATARVAVE